MPLGDEVRLLRSFIDAVPYGVHEYELHPDGRLIFTGANAAAARILGIDHAPFIGREIQEAFPSLVGTPIPAAYSRVAAKGDPYTQDLVDYRDGKIAGAFEITAFKTGPNTMAAMFRDVLERRRAEEALRRSEERHRQLVEATSDWLWEVDVGGRYTFASPKVRDLLGYSPAELMGRTPFDLMPERERGRVAALFAEAVRNRRPLSMLENVNLHRDGHEVVLETSAIPLINSAGQLTGYRGIDRDVTERRRAEQERLQIERQMQQMQKVESLGVLAGGIAHDFNNTLLAVLGNIELVMRDLPAGGESREALAEAERAARSAAELCRQMLAYAGRGRFVVEPVNLNELLQGLSRMLGVSLSRKAMLHWDLDAAIPVFPGDATQMQQVAMNLLINASEALNDRAGTITLRTATIRCDETRLHDALFHEGARPGPYVVMEVEDTGCGMAPDVMARIFEPFFSTKFAGRGMGLAAVMGIVRSHRGAIELASTEGRGSTFRILLPLPAAQTTQTAMHRPPPVTETSWRGSGTLLLADDEEAVRSLATRMLQRLGFDVIVACDGREAVETFRAQREKILGVVLDVTMPQLDGVEALRQIREIAPGLPAVLSSGYSSLEILERAGSLGQQAAFVQKPYRMADLAEAVRCSLAAARG